VLESTQDELIDTQDLLSQTDSILDSTQDELIDTRAEFSATESILESTQEELFGADSQIDEAELLLSGTAIPDASAIDATISSLFSLTPYAGQNPNDPLVQRITDGLIPYLQAALAKIGDFSNITQIAAGDFHTVVLTANGRVYATGSNSDGQLGIGTSGDFLTTLTTMIGEGESGVTAIAAGGVHTVVLKDDIAYATGRNDFGQLGTTAGNKNELTPMLSPGDTGVTAISAGRNFTIALKVDAAYATGNNIVGQLGTTAGNKAVLTLMESPGDSGVTAISAGFDHTIALKSGAAYATGNNITGQLGTTAGNKAVLTPMLSPGDTGVTAISAGANFTIALKEGGVAYGTGLNDVGQLGTTAGSKAILTLMQSPGDSGVTAIAAGNRHTVALKEGGVAYGTGFNDFGQLGTTAGNKAVLTPMLSPGDTGVTAIDAGQNFTIALKEGGVVYGTGDNDFGQLGTTAGDKAVLTPAIWAFIPLTIPIMNN
jgi:alpha-tubulin suppressor-like RCC1 family protein